MNLQSKIFALSSTAVVLLGGPLLWNVRGSVNRILMDEVGQRGLMAAEQLSAHAAAQFPSASESAILPILQAVQDQTGALFVRAIGAKGLVIAHTNVAEKGKVYVDEDTRADLRERKPSVHPGLYKGFPIMEVMCPVLLRSAPELSEDFMLSGSQESAATEYLGFVELGLPLAPAIATENRLFRRIAAILVLVGGTGILFFFIFMNHLLRPVRWLSAGTARIAQGDYGVLVPVKSTDELGSLAEDFNRMSRVLKETTVSKDLLEEKERYFRSLIENTSDLITVLDRNAVIQYESPSVTKMLGYDPYELLGTPVVGYIHPEDQAKVVQALQLGMTAPGITHSSEYRFKHKDGTWKILESFGTFIVGNGKDSRIVVNSRDVTDRELANEQRTLLITAIDQSKDSMVITDAEGVIQYVNPSFERISGYSRKEVIGQTPRVLKSGKHDKTFYEKMWTVLKAGQAWQSFLINRRKDGSLFEEEASINPVMNAAGKITHFVAVKRDVTDRRKLEEIVRQSDKMSAVGQLAAGVAHEINNPLGVILGFAQALVRRMQPHDPLEMPLKSIEKEAVRCKNLVQDLLTFSRASRAEREPIDINRTVDGALSLITAQARMAQIEVKKDLAPDLPRIMGNQNQVQQIIINLANNAMDAMKNNGVLTFKTEYLHEDDLSWVCLKIIDTGPGIPLEIRTRIFDPFFTTKPVGKGTGLGLSLVHEIIQKHSGTVAVDSRPGHTEFLIKFPVPSAGQGEERS